MKTPIYKLKKFWVPVVGIAVVVINHYFDLGLTAGENIGYLGIIKAELSGKEVVDVSRKEEVDEIVPQRCRSCSRAWPRLDWQHDGTNF